MSVKKVVKNQLESMAKNELEIYQFVANRVISSVSSFGDKLDMHTKVTWRNRVCAIRNWLTFIFVCLILAALLSSCYVSGRTIHVVTPRVDVSADTATAFTWPFNSSGNPIK